MADLCVRTQHPALSNVHGGVCDHLTARMEASRARLRRTMEAFNAIDADTPTEEIRRIRTEWQADMDAMADPTAPGWGTGGTRREYRGEE